jgi:catalase
MTPEEAEKFRWNIFDMTKVWPQAEFPLRLVGKLTLNENVSLDRICFRSGSAYPIIAIELLP